MNRLSVLLLAFAGACATAPQPSRTSERPPPSPVSAAKAAAVLSVPAEVVWGPPPEALPATPLVPPEVTETTLRNGLRVVLVEHHARPVVSVYALFPHGAVEDPPEVAGLTFLATQLVGDYYEQTEGGERLDSEKSFRRLVQIAGGNAVTHVGSDQVVLGISGSSRRLNAFLGLLAGALVRPRHGAGSFSARRNLTLDALEDLELADAETFDLLLGQAAFGDGHPYARPVEGTMEGVEALSMDHIVEHQRRLFSPRGATLLVVGDIQGPRSLREVVRVFEGWKPSEQPLAQRPPPAPRVKGDVGFIARSPSSTLQVCASRPLAELGAARLPAELLASVIGGGAGSRLGARLREGTGLSYEVSAGIVNRQHARAFLVCARVAAERGAEAVGEMRRVFEELRAAPPTEVELQCAKGRVLAGVESAGDSAPSLAAAWLEALSRGLGSPPRPAGERQKIEQVDGAELQRLASKLLAPQGLRWIISGERAPALRAAQTNRLGTPKPLTFRR